VQALGLSDAVRFTGALPARTAFARGRLMVVPSRAESLPYVVLETAAAGILSLLHISRCRRSTPSSSLWPP